MANYGQRFGKGPEKINFTQRCNLLSQYLKEKGSFGDIKIEMPSPKVEVEAKGNETSKMTMELLPNIGNLAEPSKQNTQMSSPIAPSTSIEDNTIKIETRKTTMMDSAPSQLTIFYAGQVLVYNEFPIEKAKEIIQLAKQGSLSVSNGLLSTDKTTSSNRVIPDLNVPSTLRNDQTKLVERIARRDSLHRFLAKRKDRVTAKAPYQVNRGEAPLPKQDESNVSFLEGKSSDQIQRNVVVNVDAAKPEEDTNPLFEKGQSSKFLDLTL